jgi:hypothetical protein
MLQVYEEVVLPDGTTSEFIDVAEVEVGDGRSASPVKIGSLTGSKNRRKNKASSIAVPAASVSPVTEDFCYELIIVHCLTFILVK